MRLHSLPELLLAQHRLWLLLTRYLPRSTKVEMIDHCLRYLLIGSLMSSERLA